VADIERPKIPGFAGAITLAALSRANLLSADFTLERFTQAVESIEQDMKLDVPGDEAWSSDQGIR